MARCTWQSLICGATLWVMILGAPQWLRSDDPAAVQEGQESKSKKREPIYDESADAKKQIAVALKSAKRENMRVLVTFGGNWCGWCYKLHDVFTKNEEVAPVFRGEYIEVRVDVGTNGELLNNYGKDNHKHGVPFLTVLDADGNVLTNQNTGDLEDGPHHDIEKVKSFLTTWAAKPLDADEVLKKGLDRAHSEGKLAFVHLGSPSCGWCRVLDRFLESRESLFEGDFVDIKIDISRMKNGEVVAGRLRKKPGGIPWFVFLNGKGDELVNSDGPQGNIGYPGRTHEITHFMAMLRKVTRQMSSDDLAQIQSDLEAFAAQHDLK